VPTIQVAPAGRSSQLPRVAVGVGQTRETERALLDDVRSRGNDPLLLTRRRKGWLKRKGWDPGEVRFLPLTVAADA
jgi:hypothetical protein